MVGKSITKARSTKARNCEQIWDSESILGRFLDACLPGFNESCFVFSYFRVFVMVWLRVVCLLITLLALRVGVGPHHSPLHHSPMMTNLRQSQNPPPAPFDGQQSQQ